MSSENRALLAPLVRKLESIASLSAEERRAIEQLPVHGRTLGAHQDILREKDRPAQCCLIVDGWACRYKILEEGRRQILSFHIPGDMPDLQSLHLRVMDHSIATLTPCTVGIIPHEALRDFALRFPGVGSALWRDTLVDAAIFREWMTSNGRRTAFGRVAHLFCEMYLKLEAVGLADEHRCEVPVTQSEIADALGLTSVHVNRTLQAMRGQGLITWRGGTLVIEDWQALSTAGEFGPAYLHLEGGVAA
jgi:CRP-like cAMP-binding protein